MKLKWLHVVRDVLIITGIFFVSGFLEGLSGVVTKQETPLSSLLDLNGTLGFCLCGCLTIENRWKHLLVVALGVWLINCSYQLFFLPFTVLAWVLNVAIIFVPMLIGGALSSLLARAPEQKDSPVDKKEMNGELK